jgi:hypothetical protein
MNNVVGVATVRSSEGGSMLACTKVAICGSLLTLVLWLPILLDRMPPEPWDYGLLFLAWMGSPVGTALATTLSVLTGLPELRDRFKQHKAPVLVQCVASLAFSYSIAWAGYALVATAFSHRPVWPW